MKRYFLYRKYALEETHLKYTKLVFLQQVEEGWTKTAIRLHKAADSITGDPGEYLILFTEDPEFIPPKNITQ